MTPVNSLHQYPSGCSYGCRIYCDDAVLIMATLSKRNAKQEVDVGIM